MYIHVGILNVQLQLIGSLLTLNGAEKHRGSRWYGSFSRSDCLSLNLEVPNVLANLQAAPISNWSTHNHAAKTAYEIERQARQQGIRSVSQMGWKLWDLCRVLRQDDSLKQVPKNELIV
jgi:hypothetical protein